jgi:ribosomal RNA-processing protein 12
MSLPTATAYFAALLALLTQPSLLNDQNRQQVATAVVYLLDVVTPYTPAPLLRAKFTQILSVLGPVLSQQDAAAPLLRPAIGCLETLLLAQNSASWELSVAEIGPRRAVVGLLTLANDSRPKVRRRALEALRRVLGSPPPSPSLDHPAAALCAESALETLSKAIANRKTNNSGTSGQDATLMHSVQLARAVASASGGWPSASIEHVCQALLGIARDGNQHTVMAVFDVFETIFETMAEDTASSKLPQILSAISELQPGLSDALLLPPWLAIFSRAYDVAAQLNADEVFAELPTLFNRVSGFLQSEFVSVRVSAAECLLSLLANCVPRSVLLGSTVYDERVLENIARGVNHLLAVRFQAARKQIFSVLCGIFASLKWRSDPYFLEAVRVVGELRGDESFTARQEADAVLGSAIRALGPEAVLRVLPLNLSGPNAGRPGRAWLLALLRDYTSNTFLGHFRSELVPLSETMFQRVLNHGEAEKTTEVKVFETLVQQIWSAFPGYCDLPLDLETAFDQSFAELLANLLYQQVDLRQDICRGLRALVESNQAVATIEADDDEDLVLQNRVTKLQARKNLAHLSQYAANFLSILFNVYGQTLPHSRAPLLETIDLFMSITPKSDVMTTFDRVHELLLEAMQIKPGTFAQTGNDASAESQAPSNEQTLLDLVITMSIYLPREKFSSLYTLASQVLQRSEQPQLQKKAYKLIPRLASSFEGQQALKDRIAEMQSLLLTGADRVSAPARRERLNAIATLVSLLPSTDLHFIPAVVSEVVICCKDHNERTRETAFDLLAAMGQQLASASGIVIDNTKVPHMPADSPTVPASVEEYLTMISAGLAGTTPHMISASITALSRVVYEFRQSVSSQALGELMDTVNLFLTSNNREIVKAALGLVKVAVVSFQKDFMAPRLASLVPKLLVWSHEHKGHLRAKVKHIFERMLRRFGFEAVARHCPDEDRKLLVNIRKTKERNKRKKAAGSDSDDDIDSDAEQMEQPKQFQSEFDAALYSSDDDSTHGDGANHRAARGGRASKTGGSSRNAYIVEDEDEPLDLLGHGALAKISSTKPSRRKEAQRTRPRTNEDGKLILGQDGQDEQDGKGDAMDVDTGTITAPQEESGIGAYVSALRSGDVARRGQRGKLKFSNRRRLGKDDDEATGADIDQTSRPTVSRQPQVKRQGRGPFLQRAGKGSMAPRRRGLGQDKRRGPSMPSRVNKRPFKARRGGP